MDKVYLLVEDVSYDYEHELHIEAYSNFKFAKKAFMSRRKENLDEMEDGWIIENNDETSLNICEDGDYTRNHTDLSIIVKELKK